MNRNYIKNAIKDSGNLFRDIGRYVRRRMEHNAAIKKRSNAKRLRYRSSGNLYGLCVPAYKGKISEQGAKAAELVSSYGLDDIIPLILQNEEQNLMGLRAIGADPKNQPYFFRFEAFSMAGEAGYNNIRKELKYIKKRLENRVI